MQKYPAGTLELFPFCANSYLRINCTLRKKCLASTSEFVFLLRKLGSPLWMKIPWDSFSGVPICFLWRFGIKSFLRQLGSSLELSCWHLGINSVWRQLRFHLGFAILRDSFLVIPPCFPLLGFNLIIRSWGTTFPLLRLYYQLDSQIHIKDRHFLWIPTCNVGNGYTEWANHNTWNEFGPKPRILVDKELRQKPDIGSRDPLAKLIHGHRTRPKGVRSHKTP